jgi:hypothetical protein
MRALLFGLALGLVACGGSSGPCVATIIPNDVTMAPGDAETFTSSLDGRPTGQTIWSQTGGGFIDSVGNYIAPATPGNYTVTVRDANNASCTATAQVHVVAAPADAGTDGGTSDGGTDGGP